MHAFETLPPLYVWPFYHGWQLESITRGNWYTSDFKPSHTLLFNFDKDDKYEHRHLIIVESFHTLPNILSNTRKEFVW